MHRTCIETPTDWGTTYGTRTCTWLTLFVSLPAICLSSFHERTALWKRYESFVFQNTVLLYSKS